MSYIKKYIQKFKSEQQIILDKINKLQDIAKPSHKAHLSFNSGRHNALMEYAEYLPKEVLDEELKWAKANLIEWQKTV